MAAAIGSPRSAATWAFSISNGSVTSLSAPFSSFPTSRSICSLSARRSSCARNGELKVFAWRIASAILVAGVFFLVLPLRFAFARPQSGGWLGALFGWFLALDAPFNLFPSLHAALCLLLVEVYARRSSRLVRPFVLLWFGLIALSPLFTRQHHLVDILGGFLLAICCRAFISLPASPLSNDEPAHP